MTARAVLTALPEEPDDEWHDIPDDGQDAVDSGARPGLGAGDRVLGRAIQPLEGHLAGFVVARRRALVVRPRK